MTPSITDCVQTWNDYLILKNQLFSLTQQIRINGVTTDDARARYLRIFDNLDQASSEFHEMVFSFIQAHGNIIDLTHALTNDPRMRSLIQRDLEKIQNSFN